MKQVLRTAAALAAIFVFALAASPLFAAETREVNFRQDVDLAGQTIQKGWYDLQWVTEGGETVEVRVLRKGKVVATATAKLVGLDARAETDRIVYRTNEDGTRELVEIQTAGKKEAVRIGG